MMDTLERGLAELRADLSPSSADKARLRARILVPALGGEGSPGHSAPAPPRRGRWAALKAAGTTGLAAGGVLLGVGLGVGFWLGREASAPDAARVHEATRLPRSALQQGEPPPSIAPAPPHDPSAPSPTASEPPLAAKEAPSEPRRSPPVRARAHKAVAPHPLNDELALLRRVERALRNADPALALALLGELDERFPNSRLVEERQAATLMADCRLGSPEASERARSFLSEHPASVYRQRVQLACANDTVSPAKRPDAESMKDSVRPDTSGR